MTIKSFKEYALLEALQEVDEYFPGEFTWGYTSRDSEDWYIRRPNNDKLSTYIYSKYIKIYESQSDALAMITFELNKNKNSYSCYFFVNNKNISDELKILIFPSIIYVFFNALKEFYSNLDIIQFYGDTDEKHNMYYKFFANKKIQNKLLNYGYTLQIGDTVFGNNQKNNISIKKI